MVHISIRHRRSSEIFPLQTHPLCLNVQYQPLMDTWLDGSECKMHVAQLLLGFSWPPAAYTNTFFVEHSEVAACNNDHLCHMKQNLGVSYTNQHKCEVLVCSIYFLYHFQSGNFLCAHPIYSNNLDMTTVAYVEIDMTVSMVHFMKKPQHVPEGLISHVKPQS